MKATSKIWMRLKSSALFQEIKPPTLRQWLASRVGHTTKVHSLNNLEPAELKHLQSWLEATSNRDLEAQFLQWLEAKTP
jgi:hypothetical protein